MSEDEGRGEYFLERIENIRTRGVKLPRDVLLGQAY